MYSSHAIHPTLPASRRTSVAKIRRSNLALLVSLLLFPLPSPAADYGFEIKRAALVRQDAEYHLNADIDYRFSPAAVEALEHGVPLSVVVHFELRRHRDYWPDQVLASKRRRLNIRYHPLARTYRIHSGDPMTPPQSFASLPALLETLGTIRGWNVADARRIAPGADCRALLSTSLNIEALPLPLRPVAYVSPDWYLRSPRFVWRFEG